MQDKDKMLKCLQLLRKLEPSDDVTRVIHKLEHIYLERLSSSNFSFYIEDFTKTLNYNKQLIYEVYDECIKILKEE